MTRPNIAFLSVGTSVRFVGGDGTGRFPEPLELAGLVVREPTCIAGEWYVTVRVDGSARPVLVRWQNLLL